MRKAGKTPYDISERLRAASHAGTGQAQSGSTGAKQLRGAALRLHSYFGTRRRRRLVERAGIGHPLMALVIGLWRVINAAQDENGLNEVAWRWMQPGLTDDLPPEAYADPGFMQF